MTLQTLLFMVQTLKDVQTRLRTTELLEGLTMMYELPSKEHKTLQQEIYQKFHPTMEGYAEKDVFEVELLTVKFVFIKKD